MNLKRRLQSLERRNQAVATRDPFRIILTCAGNNGPAHSTCSRTRNLDGGLTEFVDLSSRDQDMSEQELETFIAGFPIQDTNGSHPSATWQRRTLNQIDADEGR